ncbi:hypothetical protein STENM223S_09750 [Streptomyces tendae]
MAPIGDVKWVEIDNHDDLASGQGDRVPVLTRLIPSPVVVDIRAGALDDLGGVLADERISHSGKLAVAVSGGSGARLRDRVAPSLPGADWYEVGGGTIDDAVRLAGAIQGGRYDAVVGLGGGKIIDCAKFASARVGLPLVAVATNLAHDGLCSPVATLDNDAGRGSYGVPNPIAVVIDLNVIREAPSGASARASATSSPTSPP